MVYKRLGELLIANEYITPEQLNKALEIQKKTPGKKIGEIVEVDSRTSMGTDGSVLWSDGDAISLFKKTGYHQKYNVTSPAGSSSPGGCSAPAPRSSCSCTLPCRCGLRPV